MSFDLYLMYCNIMIYEFKSNVNQGLLRKRDVIGLLKNEEMISNKIFNIFIKEELDLLYFFLCSLICAVFVRRLSGISYLVVSSLFKIVTAWMDK